LSKGLPQEIEDRLKRTEGLIDPQILEEIRSFSQEDIIDLLEISLEETFNEMAEARTRFFSATLLLGDIKSEKKRHVEAHYIKDAFVRFQILNVKFRKLSEIREKVTSCETNRKPHYRKSAPLLRLFPEGET